MAPLDRSTLEAQITLLREQVAALTTLVEQLRRENASLKKDSSNSSKPPSSDLVKPPKPRKGKPGGSDRLRRRTAFLPEELDRVVDHDHPLDPLVYERLDEPSVFQQVVLEPDHRRIRVVASCWVAWAA